MEDCATCGKPNSKMGYATPIGFKLFCCTLCANHYMGYPLDYPLELDSPEHYVFESEELEESDIIPIGSKVRSYDFVVGKHILRDDCYFEGVIEKFEPIPTCSPDCNHYIVRTTKIVREGKEEDIVEGSNDYFTTHWNNYGVIPLTSVTMEAENYTPPAAAVAAAKKGLSQRKKWSRGGLSPAEAKSQGIDSGVTRARKIASGKVSRHDVRRMSAFNRHRKNNKPSKKMPDGGPTAGTIAWNLWGGSAGVNWAKKKSAAMNAEEVNLYDFDAEDFIFVRRIDALPREERITTKRLDGFKLIPKCQALLKDGSICGKPIRGDRTDEGQLCGIHYNQKLRQKPARRKSKTATTETQKLLDWAYGQNFGAEIDWRYSQ